MEETLLEAPLPEGPVHEAIEGETEEPSATEKLAMLAAATGDISNVIDADTLRDLGARVVEDYEQDRTDREDWEKIVKEALKAAAQEAKGETKNYPWPNASNISYPLLTVAALQFNARAYPAIVKGDEAVSIKIVGKDNGRPLMGEDGQPVMQQGPDGQPQPVFLVPPGGKASRASRVRDYLNTTIFYRMEDWEEDTDALLLQLPIVGSVFRKVWYDVARRKHCAAMVPALRVFAPKGAKSVDTTPRLTEEVPDQYPVDILAKMRSGFYRDVDLYGLYTDGASERVSSFDRDPRMLLEQYRLLDLDEDGVPEPYVVTVDHETREVLRVEPNFGPEGIEADETGAVLSISAGRYWVKYDFFPAFDGGFYGSGLGHLLKQMGSVVDTALNQMIDAGTAQVAGGGFIASGVRLTGNKRTGTIRFGPGEYKTVDATADQLRAGIYERTSPGASPVMFQVLDMILSAAKDISSVKDVITGEGSTNGQVGTTLALIEQGLQVFTAIYKRIYRSLKKEYTILFGNVGRYASEAIKQDYRDLLDDPAADFDADFNAEDMDIRPISDPAAVTKMQKMARAQFLMQFVSAPGVNPQAIMRRAWEAADVEDIDDLLVPMQPPQPNPKDVAQGEKLQAGAVLDMEKAQTEKAKREQLQLDTLASAFGAGQQIGLVA
ncbi:MULTISPECIES: hypothetical protein [unclassified Sphingomonas]|uniref:hypothetical protein n=1 Tax=unclassified Sphingomonas TaxID=196159 RepID=UPI0006F9A2AC|nr:MULTISPECIES: hypothetical protein [unclassified Sphingomonas]KQM58777.1 hypothetical protein ASE65_10460 [Sphingomonas sp. Leaf16]KQN11032.1 hypothetical protein ASE81_11445 [Sphingomonas sp. Leaf29]KQN18334.1 hypothetical protein ASE83_11385 [Sphingomonas sp. Leaf32]